MSKISELSATSAVTAVQLLPVVDDPSGTPATQKATVAQLSTFLAAETKTLTNKTLTSPVLTTPTLGAASATSITCADGTAAAPAFRLATDGASSGFYRVGGNLWSFVYNSVDIVVFAGPNNRLQLNSLSFPSVGADTFVTRVAAGIVAVSGASAVGGAIDFKEMTAPSAPAADHGVLYVEDTGGGKSRLVVRFNSGAAQVIATEP